MLKIKNVTKYYGDFLAVDNLSFEVKPGEIFGLLGVNGAGKTTTFRMIMGLLDKTEGEITYNDKPIDYSVTDKIGFLTEERSLLTKLTVLEQIEFYGLLKSMPKKDISGELDILLERFGIPEYKNRKIKELSKGNQQKIQFISAIIHKPKLLILDEPFSGLDPINVELFKSIIRDLKEEGTIIIFSSHRMDHVELFCEKVLILLNGETVINGKIEKIKKDFKRKNIFIKGNITKKELMTIKGVINVVKNASEFVVSIKDQTIVEEVFKVIKTKSEITKFIVDEPSLEEIFIEKVGDTYDA